MEYCKTETCPNGNISNPNENKTNINNHPDEIVESLSLNGGTLLLVKMTLQLKENMRFHS